MDMTRILFGCTALIAFMGVANAADLPVAPPAHAPAMVAVAPVYNWTGCFIGAGYGYGVTSQDTFGESDPTHVRSTVTGTVSGRGWYGMGQTGCDYQFPALNTNFVIGLFGDGEFGSIKANNVAPLSGAPGPGGLALAAPEKETTSWAVGVRGGWLVTPKFLTYFSGGYTQAHFNQLTYGLSTTGAPAGFISPAETYSGYFLGSGFEYGLDFIPGLFWKTEYRYAAYSAKDVQVQTAAGAATGFAFNSKPAIQTISTELVYRFNWIQ
jgi:outer membrane immunogenic protein